MHRASPPTDRRALRTERALRDALFASMQCKHYTSISVEEVCERADVGRSTFYEHFHGKDDLKRTWVRTLDDQLEMARRSGGAFSFSLPLLRHAREHLPHIRALGFGHGRDVGTRALRDLVSNCVRRELLADGEAPSLHMELAVQFFTGAFMAVMDTWLASGAHHPPEDVDAMFRTLAIAGM